MWSPALLLGYTCGHKSLLWWPDTASDFLSIARRGLVHLAAATVMLTATMLCAAGQVGSRPADVLVPHWIGGKDAALDITVVNPCQTATVVGAATTAGHSLNFAYTRKVRGRPTL